MTNNPTNDEVICWNCYKKTPPPVCIHCGARLRLMNEQIQDDTNILVKPEKIFYEIPGTDIRINLNTLFEIITKYFEIISLPAPTKLVMKVKPLEENVKLEEILVKIKEEVSNIAPGLYPFLSRDNYHKESMLLSFRYVPVFPTLKWLKVINYLFIFLSALIPAYSWLVINGVTQLTTIFKISKTILFEALLIFALFLMGFLIQIFLGTFFYRKKSQERQSNIVVPSIPSVPVGAIAWLNESLEPPYSKEKQVKVELTKWFSHFVYSILLLIIGLLIPWGNGSYSPIDIGNALNPYFGFLFSIMGFYIHSSPIYFAGILYFVFVLIQGLPLGNLLGGRMFSVITTTKIQNILLAVVIFLLLNLDLTIGIFSLFIFFFSRKIPPMDNYSQLNNKQRFLALFPIIFSMLLLTITIFNKFIPF